MNLNQLIEKLLYLQENGFGQLIVAFDSDDGPIIIREAFVTRSSDEVGQYVQLLKKEIHNDKDNN